MPLGSFPSQNLGTWPHRPGKTPRALLGPAGSQPGGSPFLCQLPCCLQRKADRPQEPTRGGARRAPPARAPPTPAGQLQSAAPRPICDRERRPHRSASRRPAAGRGSEPRPTALSGGRLPAGNARHAVARRVRCRDWRRAALSRAGGLRSGPSLTLPC